MTLPPQRPVRSAGGLDDDRPGWGLGDVAAGIFASLFLSALAGALILSIFGWSEASDVPVWGLALLQVPLWAGYLIVVVLAARKGRGVVADFGLRTTLLDAPLGLVIGILTQVVVVPIMYLPILELVGSDSEELSRPARELAGRAGSAPSWILFGLLVGICAPVVEELFYRGLFLRSLTKRGLGQGAAVLLSSLAFAAIHLQPLQFPGLLVVGLIAGALAVRTGRLGPAIWTHIGFNMTTVVVLALFS